jgi:hypothetical protein
MAEARISQAAALVELDAQSVRASQAAALVELDAQSVRASQAALLIEIDQIQIHISQMVGLIEFEYEPAPEPSARSALLVTAAILYRAPVGEAVPDETTIGYGEAWGGNWMSLGYTLEPLRFSLESDLVHVRVEQLLSAVRIFRRQEGLVLETTLAEMTTENLEMVFDGAVTVGDGYAVIEVGGNFAMREWAWGFEGYRLSDAGEKLPVRFFVHKGVAVLAGALRMGKGTPTGIPLRIEAVADLTRPAGKQLVESHIVTAKAA